MSQLDGQATAPSLATIGAYRVVRQLGQGGMGTVFLGEHALLGRRAAIKVLHPQFSVREDIVERFFNEARATTSIADPGIVQVFDFGYHDGVAYIVMEHLVGDTLLARLRPHRALPEAEVLRFARQLASSLQTAHARGVVHRDLKPDNVFIVADPEAPGGERTKILDFGIAKLTDDPDRHRTQTGLVLGTPSYMSPEQCRGAGEVDHRADVYSLGCIMFRCLTGRLVFEAQGSGELIAMHLREPAQPPSRFASVRPELDAIVLRCLAKDPAERYQSMHELAVEVDALLRVITAPPGTSYATATPLPAPPADAERSGVLVSSPPRGELAHAPTTLSSAAAEVARSHARPRWRIVAVTALVVAGGGIAALVASTGGSTPPHRPTVTPAPAPVAATPPAPIADAAVPTTLTPDAAAPAAIAPDAPMPAAAVPADAAIAPIDAGVARPQTRSKRDAGSPAATPTRPNDLYDDR